MALRLAAVVAGAAVAAAVVFLALRGAAAEQEPARPAAMPARTVIWALGDGADGSAESKRLARYVRVQRPDRFLYLGDVYRYGGAAAFTRNYDPVYGALAARTDAAIGNHEYARRASGYLPYWRRARGFGSGRALRRAYVDASGWQVIVYSSESDPAREAAWVRRQVARHPGTCRVAAGHRGRYVVADDEHTDNPDQALVWAALAGRTAVNLVGHNHLYGRLAPIDGVRVLVSGAGGHELRGLGRQQHPVAASTTGVPTATRLALRAGALDFSQVDARGRVHDAGTIRCAPAR
jgi:hypothetical protein